MTIAEDRETWRDNLVTTGDGIRRMLENAKRIAVLGIKREYDRPA